MWYGEKGIPETTVGPLGLPETMDKGLDTLCPHHRAQDLPPRAATERMLAVQSKALAHHGACLEGPVLKPHMAMNGLKGP